MISNMALTLKRNRSLLMRVGVVAGTVGLSPVLGFLFTKVSPLLVIAAIIGAVSAPVVLRNLQVGPMLILAAATATEWYISKGITPALILTAVFVGIWLTQQIVLNHRLALVKSPVMMPALGFMLVAAISLPWGKAMADPLLVYWPDFGMVQLAQLAVLALSPAALILTANLITTRRDLMLLVCVYLGMTTVGILLEFVHFPFHLNLRGINSTWAVGLLYGQLLYNKKMPWWNRLAFILIVALWLFVKFLVGITWLSGWLPVVVTVGVLTFFKSRKATLLLLLVAVIFVFASAGWWEEIWGAEEGESGNRFDKWSFLFAHHSTRGHWFLGTGPFGYALYFMTYFPDNSASTHSNYIDIYLQMGVVGCVVFVWLMGALARVGYKLHTMSIKDPFIAGFAASGLAGLVSVLVAMFFGDWFTPFVLNQGLHGFSWTVNSWIFLGALVAVPFILDNEQKRKDIHAANAQLLTNSEA